ncbi:MAG: hypothetical protein H7A53_07045 [Akkermansiaceae bacterium]|nr:hypothetical protein [Akkermansiaceae bacterium]MCP5550629.1 hypothetical protein [Akkermansiaceae bacterium]
MNSPKLVLAFLVLAALAGSGWLYGVHWKRVARGDDLTQEERLIVDLQDQLDALRAENAELRRRLGEATAPGPAQP